MFASDFLRSTASPASPQGHRERLGRSTAGRCNFESPKETLKGFGILTCLLPQLRRLKIGFRRLQRWKISPKPHRPEQLVRGGIGRITAYRPTQRLKSLRHLAPMGTQHGNPAQEPRLGFPFHAIEDRSQKSRSTHIIANAHP